MSISSLQIQILLAVACLSILVANDLIAQIESANDQYGIVAGHYERGEYGEAIQQFRVLIRNYPKSDEAVFSHFFLGEALILKKDYRSAYPSFQIFVKRFPDDEHSKLARFRMAECAYRLQWSQQSINLLEKFAQRYPKDKLNELALYFLGESRLRRGEPQLARRVFEQALSQFPSSPQSNRIRFGLAKSLQALGQVDQAVRYYQMLTAQPADELCGLARLQLGIIEFQNSRYASASENLLNALAGNISDVHRAEAKYWLARTEMAMDRVDVALQYFSEIEDSQIDERLKAAILFDGAIAAYRSGQNQLSLKWLRRIQNTWPDSSRADDALQMQIELQYKENAFEDAMQGIERFKKEFAKNDNLPFIVEYEGRIHYDRGEYQKTIDTFQSLVDQYGKSSDYDANVDIWRYFTGLAYLGMEDYQSAENHFGSIKIEKRDAEFKSNVLLAAASAAVGSNAHRRAIELLGEFLKTDPRGSKADRARADLAVAYAQSDQWQDATRTLTELEQHASNPKVFLETTLVIAEYALLDKQYDFSEECFTRLANPANPRKYVVRGMSGIAWARMSRGDEQSSVQVFEQLLTEFAETRYAPEAAMVCGRYFEQNGDFDRSTDMYRLVRSRFADSDFVPMATLRLAYSLHKVGGSKNINTAEEILNRFRSDASEMIDEALYQLAWIYLDTQRTDKADKLFREISNSYYESRYWEDSTYRVAQQLVANAEFDEATALLKELRGRVSGSDLDSLVNFLQGQVAIHEKNWPQVREQMDRVLSQTDDELLRKKARYWLAESWYQTAEWQSAIDHLQRLIADPNLISEDRLAWVYLRRVQCLAYQEHWSEALKLATAGRKRFPDFEASHEFDFVAGRAHAAQGRLADARTAYRNVVNSPTGKTTQTAAMAQWRIGQTWFHQEEFEKAIAAFYRVDSLYSYEKWRAAALVEAGKCQEHLGNWPHAIKLYEQLIERFPDSQFQTAARERLRLATRQARQTAEDKNK